MTGLETVLKLRRQGFKPSAVYIDLVQDRSRIPAFSDFGIVTVEVFPTDSINSIDFRPLVGLNVMLNDYTDSPKRLRSASKAIAEANPCTFVVPTLKSGVWTIHRRFAGDPPTIERMTCHEA
jgi:hypothetical protein